MGDPTIEHLERALRTIRGPASDDDLYIGRYREAGGGYEGLQAVAKAALDWLADHQPRAAGELAMDRPPRPDFPTIAEAECLLPNARKVAENMGMAPEETPLYVGFVSSEPPSAETLTKMREAAERAGWTPGKGWPVPEPDGRGECAHCGGMGETARRRCPGLASPADIFGRNLLRAREAAGLSQEALADKADMHRNEISLLERGQREPKIGTVVKLAKALGIPLTDLLKGL